jgi:hypothetical protein
VLLAFAAWSSVRGARALSYKRRILDREGEMNMQGAGRITKLALVLAVGSILGVAAAQAADPGTGVTLINDGKRPVTLFVRYGGEGDCGSQSKAEEINIAAGQSQTIDAAKVCICLKVPERDTCPSGWSEAKGGSKRRFQ